MPLLFPGVAISTYAKYCYHKLQKAALTGAKKVGQGVGRELVLWDVGGAERKERLCSSGVHPASGGGPASQHCVYRELETLMARELGAS